MYVSTLCTYILTFKHCTVAGGQNDKLGYVDLLSSPRKKKGKKEASILVLSPLVFPSSPFLDPLMLNHPLKLNGKLNITRQ